MAQGHGAPQPVQKFRCKDLPHQTHILIKGELPVSYGGDAAGLLPPVLEGIQALVDGAGTVSGGIPYAEYAAFLVNGHSHSSWEKIKWAL